jgi:bifunctional non-homologous end joining protein LigD
MCRGKNVMSLPLERRRALLTEVLQAVRYPVIQSIPFAVRPAEIVAAATTLELEGVIAKRKGSCYEPGRRSGAWVKYKINRAQEFVIGGYTEGYPFDALIVGCYEGPELHYVSKVRAGFNPAVRRQLYRFLQPLRTDRCPFANLPQARRQRWGLGLTAEEMARCRWVTPALAAQIEFREWTPDGHLRHPRYAGLREDKDPREIRRE